jgi:peptidoglycan/LPS O-acetylase OafA/YrhL
MRTQWGDVDVARTGFNLNVQGCRGLFACMVLVHHVQNSGLGSGAFWANSVSQFYFMGFQYAVELFFGISGYVIAVPLAQAKSARSFLGDRLLRLMPLFMMIHLLLFTLGPIFHAKLFVDADLWTWCTLFVTNTLLLPGIFDLPIVQPQAWSLSYEMLYYVLAATYYFYLRRLDRLPRIVLTTVVLVWLFDRYPRSIFFSIGVIARQVEPWLWQRPSYQRFNRVSPVVYLLLMLTCWRGIDFISGVGAIDHMRMLDWLADIRIVLAFAAYGGGLAFFVTMLHDDGAFGRAMQSRLFQYLGTISYSFYLWHPLIMYGVKRILRNIVLPHVGDAWGKTLLFVCAMASSLVAAHLSYLFIEQKFARKAKAFFATPAAQPRQMPMVAEAHD